MKAQPGQLGPVTLGPPQRHLLQTHLSECLVPTRQPSEKHVPSSLSHNTTQQSLTPGEGKASLTPLLLLFPQNPAFPIFPGLLPPPKGSSACTPLLTAGKSGAL